MGSLWRESSRLVSGQPAPKNNQIFPSGRQAIGRALQEFGLGRSCRVAIPEFSSACVISAIGRYSTPLPMREVIEYQIPVDAVLAYEQWGWPFRNDELSRLRQGYPKIILDCVDSPDAVYRHDEILETSDINVVISLSKCLGLPGGGLLKGGKGWFEASLDGAIIDLDMSNPLVVDYTKSHLASTEYLTPLLDNHNILMSLSLESGLRADNLTCLLNSSLSDCWPNWMRDAVTKKCAAGIAPLLRGISAEKLQLIADDVMRQFGICTQVYNFNWSGSPLLTEYEPCLAFPTHGEISLDYDLVSKIADAANV